jgi:hypothetical protein
MDKLIYMVVVSYAIAATATTNAEKRGGHHLRGDPHLRGQRLRGQHPNPGIYPKAPNLNRDISLSSAILNGIKNIFLSFNMSNSSNRAINQTIASIVK